MTGPVADAERRSAAAPSQRRDGATADVPGSTATATAPVATPASIGRLGVQAKTRVGAVGDSAEREADSVADRIMRVPAPATVIEPAPGSAAADARPEDLRRQPVPVTEPPRAEAGPEPAGAAPGESAAAPEGGEVDDAVQSYLDRSEGRGVPLPPGALGYFETTFGRDLGHVRIHDDPEADTAARSVGALAFTRGNHIHLAAGQYDPQSEPGRRLLAHELTHVVQQDTRLRRTGGPVLQRATKPAAAKKPPPTSPVYTDKEGNVFDAKNRTLDIKKFLVPDVKEPLLKPLPLTVLPKSKRQNQRQLYEPLWQAAALKKIIPKLTDRITTLGKAAEGSKADWKGGPPPTPTVYYLEYGTQGNWNFIGTPAEIGEGLWRPVWDKDGEFGLFQIDHKLDWMVGGPNKIENLRLLDAKANLSLGGLVGTKLSKLLDRIYVEAVPNVVPPKPRRDTFDEKFTIKVLDIGKSGEKPAGKPDRVWELSDTTQPNLDSPDLAKWLKPLKKKRREELIGETDRVVIFSNVFGGSFHDVPLVGGQAALDKGKRWKRDSVFEVTSVELTRAAPNSRTGDAVGKLTVHPYKGNKYVRTKTVDLKIISMAAVKHGGYVSTEDARSQIRLAAAKWSPIEVDALGFDVAKGFVGRARLISDLPLLKNADIGLVLDERGIGVNAMLSGGSFSFPGPFQITGGIIEIYGSLDELSIKGDVFFEIDKLARGRLGAAAGTRTGFELSGEIDFDTELFTKARIGATYRDGKWGVKGELGIGPGKVAGIKSATVAVTVDDSKVDAKGEFESSLKGLERGTLGFKYDPATGIVIEGGLAISKLPGIRGGQIAARIAERKDGQGWSLAGQVTAEPAVPGATGQITGRYEDGAFLVDANLGYRRGLLDGRVHLGLTNQAIGPDGKPAGPPTDAMLVYGGGQATLRLAPWLAASAGLEYKPNGEVVITGRIGLPQALDLFAEKRFDRNIFSIGLDIPIIGVAVVGQRIGIFATIRGGLDVSAGIGPGQLRELGLEVTYNPDREDETRVAGKAQFVVPASAGLRLFVRGGLGVGIPVVSATAGLEVSGALGLAGAAVAGVDVMWTPARGLVLDARGEIFVEPRFRFAVDAFVDVSADLWVKTIEIYRKKWSLAAFEYGSGLRFGVIFPVHYEEGRPFDLSLDQLQFVYPTIDTGELLRGLVAKVVSG